MKERMSLDLTLANMSLSAVTTGMSWEVSAAPAPAWDPSEEPEASPAVEDLSPPSISDMS